MWDSWGVGSNWHHCRLGIVKRSNGGQAFRGAQPARKSVSEDVTESKCNGKPTNPMTEALQ